MCLYHGGQDYESWVLPHMSDIAQWNRSDMLDCLLDWHSVVLKGIVQQLSKRSFICRPYSALYCIISAVCGAAFTVHCTGHRARKKYNTD